METTRQKESRKKKLHNSHNNDDDQDEKLSLSCVLCVWEQTHTHTSITPHYCTHTHTHTTHFTWALRLGGTAGLPAVNAQRKRTKSNDEREEEREEGKTHTALSPVPVPLHTHTIRSRLSLSLSLSSSSFYLRSFVRSRSFFGLVARTAMAAPTLPHPSSSFFASFFYHHNHRILFFFTCVGFLFVRSWDLFWCDSAKILPSGQTGVWKCLTFILVAAIVNGVMQFISCSFSCWCVYWVLQDLRDSKQLKDRGVLWAGAVLWYSFDRSFWPWGYFLPSFFPRDSRTLVGLRARLVRPLFSFLSAVSCFSSYIPLLPLSSFLFFLVRPSVRGLAVSATRNRFFFFIVDCSSIAAAKCNANIIIFVSAYFDSMRPVFGKSRGLMFSAKRERQLD